MKLELPGLHHVTAITADGRRNIDFYTRVLGLRLVKVTVNFDDPSSYHLYYGDRLGRPGTAMTFFAWEGVPAGRTGVPMVAATQFLVPAGALPFWQERLQQEGMATDAIGESFGLPVLACQDPDGLPLELVASPDGEGIVPDVDSDIADAFAIRGFHGVRLATARPARTAAILTDVMGFESMGVENGVERYRGTAWSANVVDVQVESSADLRRGVSGSGTVHHVAFRTPGGDHQVAWKDRLEQDGQAVSPVMERCYFQSIYFREPGGVLFEIATEGPGFTFDEEADALGQRLCLPAWLETNRDAILAALPPLPGITT